MKTLLSFLVLGTLLALGLASCARATVEQPAYNVRKKDGKFEVRAYPAMKMATAPMDAEGAGKNKSFGKLFRYIQGDNASKTKISMTSPVLIDQGADGRTMGFIVPEKVAAGEVPEPAAKDVKITGIAAGEFAALRFPGIQSPANEKRAWESLAQWLATNKLQTDGSPVFAYYDPPWTPTPLRRNEVLVRLKAE